MEPTDTTPEKKKRGRPPLPPELKKPKKYSRGISGRKEGGYISQKKYRESHAEEIRQKEREKRKNAYEIRIRVPSSMKQEIINMAKERNVNPSNLFIKAFEEKFQIKIEK